MIVFSCSCGKNLKVSPEHAGRQLGCPGCGTLLTVPQPAQSAIQATPPPSVPAMAPATAPDDDWEDEPAPRRSGGGGNKILFWGFSLVFLGFLFTATAGSTYFGLWLVAGGSGAGGPGGGGLGGLLQPQKPQSPITMLPAEAKTVLHFRVAEIWNSQLVQQLNNQGKIPAQGLQKMRAEIGMGMSEIESATVALATVPDTQIMNGVGLDKYWTIIKTTRPYDKSKVQTSLAPTNETQTHSGKTFFKVKQEAQNAGQPPQPDGYLYFIDDRTFVIATQPAMISFLDRTGAPAAHLERAKQAAVGNQLTALILMPNDAREKLLQQGKALGGIEQMITPFFAVDSLLVTAKMQGGEIVADLDAGFPDMQKAEGAATLLRGIITLAKGQLDAMRRQGGGPPGVNADQLEAVLNSVNVTTNGQNVHATARVSEATISAMMQNAPGF